MMEVKHLDIHDFPQWYNTTKAVPKGLRVKGWNKLVGAKSYEDARKIKSPNYGFVFTADDQFIGFDVDVDPSGEHGSTEVPQELLDFIAKNPTHIHTSPSGIGLHVLYRVDETTRLKLKDITRVDSIIFKGDIRFSRHYMNFTDDYLTQEDISSITYDTLLEIAPDIEKERPDGISDDDEILFSAGKMGDIEKVLESMKKIPSSFSHPSVQKALPSLQGTVPNDNYHYWLYAGMAIADAVIRATTVGEILLAEELRKSFVVWSREGEGYTSDSDVLKKLDDLIDSSMEGGKVKISYKYLNLLAQLVEFNYPDLNSKGKPLLGSLDNYKALADRAEISLVQDTVTNTIRVYSPKEDTIQKFFSNRNQKLKNYSEPVEKDSLKVYLTGLAQKSQFAGFSQSHGLMMVDYMRAKKLKRGNEFLEWVESKKWDGEERFQKFIETIEFKDGIGDKERDVYQMYLRNNILCMVGLQVYTGRYRSTPGIVGLQGLENTRKTTWVGNLMPPKMQTTHVWSPNASQFANNLTELNRGLMQTMIINIDEFDSIPASHSSELKSILTRSIDSARAMRADQVTRKERVAVFWGSTNSRELTLTSNGSRRMWVIPVKYCDTDAQANMDLQQVYAEVLVSYREHQARGDHNPWNLTEAEMKDVYNLNKQYESISNIGQTLRDHYGEYDQPIEPEEWLLALGPNWKEGKIASLNNPRLMTANQVINELGQFNGKTKQMRHELEEYCGGYTDTKYTPFKFKKHEILRGKVKVGSSQRFLLPMASEIQDAMADDDGENDIS